MPHDHRSSHTALRAATRDYDADQNHDWTGGWSEVWTGAEIDEFREGEIFFRISNEYATWDVYVTLEVIDSQ